MIRQTKFGFNAALLHPQHWLTWLVVALYFLLSLLPIALLDFIGDKLGDFFSKKNNKRYGYVKTNLTLCFPDKTEDAIETMCADYFQALMRSVMHYGKLWWNPDFACRNLLSCKVLMS